jgi:hypothetical protein
MNIQKIVEQLVKTVSIVFLSGLFVYLIWNAIIPDLFSLKQITYWQSVGLFILCNIFFKDGIALSHVVEAINNLKKKL